MKTLPKPLAILMWAMIAYTATYTVLVARAVVTLAGCGMYTNNSNMQTDPTALLTLYFKAWEWIDVWAAIGWLARMCN